MPLNIAIDGPSGAGKSSLAKNIAKILDCFYIDTGALYRTIGLYMLSSGIDTKDPSAVALALKDLSVNIRFIDGVQHVFANGKDVSSEIRTQEVAMAGSNVSAVPEVRAFLIDIDKFLCIGGRYGVRHAGQCVKAKADQHKNYCNSSFNHSSSSFEIRGLLPLSRYFINKTISNINNIGAATTGVATSESIWNAFEVT